ncbi:minor tail protein [Gordonia phage LittleFella]|nr:minor tail protein [Gordonia phage LittleFella]
MAYVWYIGKANRRELRGEEWPGGLVVWNVKNGFSLPQGMFTSDQLNVLDADKEFLLNQEGEIRSLPSEPDPVFGDNMAEYWYSKTRQLHMEILHALEIGEFRGEKGDKGDQGIPGPKGDKGDKGDQGIQGLQGIQGPQGVKGDTGNTGATGRGFNPRGSWLATTAYAVDDIVVQGGETWRCTVAHTSGATWSSTNWERWAQKGATGQGYTYRGAWAASTAYALYQTLSYQGSFYQVTTAHTSTSTFDATKFALLAGKGDTGSIGPTGPKGDKGDKGDTGEQGVQGIQGVKGDQGIQGVKGDKGDKGDMGEGLHFDYYPATYAEMLTIPSPFNGAVAIVLSTTRTYIYNGGWPLNEEDGIMLRGPMGPAGPDGPQGPQGDVGPQGNQGEQGPQGIQGVKGDKGDKGDTGEQGPKGDTGAEGSQGPQGIQGIQGVKGDKGDKGDTGDPGVVVGPLPGTGVTGKIYVVLP